ncbi:type 1 glutamine amidotransferase [Paenibacillus turpanensis]|uniref:type 1 glutamine amidotransferase n=1 Tax=Paenibacillus turpanensis TaxID=2689078 RepID=UPI00140CB95B|nr:type 1 glutamine amidotransferase [Paenibacillus turpanensis]
MRVTLFTHFLFDDESSIMTWAKRRGDEVRSVFVPDADFLPDQEEVDMLIILGGPMSVYHEPMHPWLSAEKRYLREYIQTGKPVVGICLGAQMAAEVLGARVYRNSHKELGWHQIRRSGGSHPFLRFIPEQFYSFQWHGDAFEIPPGAVGLAESDACPNQAFLYKENVLGLQYHLEATPSAIRRMLHEWRDELIEAPFIQNPESILADLDRTEASHRLLHQLLDRFLVWRERPEHVKQTIS